MSGMISIGDLLDDGGPSTNIDIEVLDISEKDIKKLKIGQYVEVMICGVVGRLSIPPTGGTPSVGLRVDKRSVNIINSAQEAGIRSLADDTDSEDSADMHSSMDMAGEN